MGRTPRARGELDLLIDQLESVRPDQCGGPLGVLPHMRAALGLDALVYARTAEKTQGWTLEGFESDGLCNPTRFRRLLGDFFATRCGPGPWLDLARPEPSQCNTAIIVSALAQFDQSELCTRVLKPMDLENAHVVRVLLCEDDGVRGWLGGFSSKAIELHQRTSLESLALPLLIRMRMERLLGATPRIHAALDAALQELGASALLVDARGRIHEMNRAARELVRTQRADVTSSIAALIAREQPTLPFTLTRIGGSGPNDRFLAILQPRSAEARRTLAVTLAGFRWSLTAQQVAVLQMIVHGDSNAEIAKQLAISARAAELHVSSIFDRARVSNRAQLVAAATLI